MRWNKRWIAGDRPQGTGQTLVEFALALPILLLLTFGIMEFGRLFQSWSTVNYAANEAARYALTGQGYSAGAGVREAQITTTALDACAGIAIDLSANGNAPGYVHVDIRSSYSSGDPTQERAGGPNEFVRVGLTYNHPLMFDLFGSEHSYVTLDAAAQRLNEPFARPTGEMGGLPPTPRATWTLSPTRTPTPTATPTATGTPAVPSP